jgi:dipeptidyl-peptidase-4
VADYPILDINETPGKLENIKYPMIGQKSENRAWGFTTWLRAKPFSSNHVATRMII